MQFEDTRDADDAVYELNGKELCGERVIIEHARGPRRDRDGYSGGYGGGGRSEYHLIPLSVRLNLFLNDRCDGAAIPAELIILYFVLNRMAVSLRGVKRKSE